MVGEEPQHGHAGSADKAINLEVPAATSTTSRRAAERLPSRTAMTSEAIQEPITPQVAPKTPASAQVGTEAASGTTG